MWRDTGACAFLSSAYVASFYVWNDSLNRNHPSVIKKRFLSALIMSIVAPIFLWINLSEESLSKATLLENMGIRIPGLILALVLPLLLTSILYLGPLAMYTISGMWSIYKEPMYWWNNFNDLMWVRTHVVAPLTEELVYRACMMPLILQSFSPTAAVIICPFFFGIAHFHHALERLKNGQNFLSTFIESFFQFSYTTLFGAYSAFLFFRTGHLAAPVIAHAFCNHMGLPNFGAIRLYPLKQGIIISILFVVGLILWGILLVPLTDPCYYHNKLLEKY